MFDLDNTLLDGDSDVSWAEFLIAKGHIDAGRFHSRNLEFADDYHNCTLDLDAYTAFVTGPMQQLWPLPLAELQVEYQQQLRAMMLPAAIDLIRRHRERGDYTMIMTATCNFIAGGVCDAFAVDSWMATMLELDQSGITGRIMGTPCFQAGKKTLLQQWLAERSQFVFLRTWFYSDSYNDLPLLQAVARPVAVDPDPALRAHAEQYNWPVISLRSDKLTRIPYVSTSTHASLV